MLTFTNFPTIEALDIRSLKKGDTVYTVRAWNFCGFIAKSFNKDNSTDQISITKWFVHSAGKKEMKLILASDTSKMSKSNVYVEQYCTSPYSVPEFAATLEEAKALAEALYAVRAAAQEVKPLEIVLEKSLAR